MTEQTFKPNDIIEHNNKVAIVKRILSDDQGDVLLIQYLGSRAIHHIDITNNPPCNITEVESRQVLRVAQDLWRVVSEYQLTLINAGGEAQYGGVSKLLSELSTLLERKVNATVN